MVHLSRMRPWDALLGVIASAITVFSRAECTTTTTHILMLLIEARVPSSACVGPIARVLRNGSLRPIACQVSCRVV